MIYADTECILEPIQGCDGNPDSAFTRTVNRHVGCGAASLTVFAHGELEKSTDLHRGKDSIKDWCKSLKNQVTRAIKYKQKDMDPLTAEQRKSHKEAKKCFICQKCFKKEDKEDFKMRKVRDHCHYTGKYRGAAHSICNLQYRIPSFIPVVDKCRHCYMSTKSKQLDEEALKKSFANTYKYYGGDDGHFRLLLRKGVYPYEYMDSFERFKEHALPSID